MHAPQSREAQAAREGAQRAGEQRSHVVPTGRNANMVKWGDHVERIGTQYLDENVMPLLQEMGGQVAQGWKGTYTARGGSSPEANAAMARLHVYVSRIPLIAGTEISQADDPSRILRAVNEEQTKSNIEAVMSAAPWVDSRLATRLGQVLSNERLVLDVLQPAAQQAGLVQ